MRCSIHRRATSSIAYMVIQIASVFLALIVVSALVKHIDATREHSMGIPRGTLGIAKDGLAVKDITGFSSDANQSDYEGIIIAVKPAQGSDGIDLTSAVIYVQVGNKTARLQARNGTTQRDVESGYYTS